MPLQECGLLSRDRFLSFDYHDDDQNNVLLFFINRVAFLLDFKSEVELRKKQVIENRLLFNEDAYFLTGSGIELFHCVKNTSNIETSLAYYIACFLYYERKYKNASLEIHVLNDVNSYINNDLLHQVRERDQKVNEKTIISLLE